MCTYDGVDMMRGFMMFDGTARGGDERGQEEKRG